MPKRSTELTGFQQVLTITSSHLSKKSQRLHAPVITVSLLLPSRNLRSRSAAKQEKQHLLLLSILSAVWKLFGNQWQQTRALKSYAEDYSWSVRILRPGTLFVTHSALCIMRIVRIFRLKLRK